MLILNQDIMDQNDIDSSFYLSLEKNEKDNYLLVYSLYYYYLLKYIESKLELKHIEDYLNSISFKGIKVEKMDYHQILASDLYDYFYIENHLYVERLSADEISNLEYLYNNSINEVNDEVKELIEKTIEKVIIRYPNVDKDINVFYGPDILEYSAPNLCLVLGIRYDYDVFSLKNEDTIDTINRLIELKNKKLKQLPNDLEVNIKVYNNLNNSLVKNK